MLKCAGDDLLAPQNTLAVNEGSQGLRRGVRIKPGLNRGFAGSSAHDHTVPSLQSYMNALAIYTGHHSGGMDLFNSWVVTKKAVAEVQCELTFTWMLHTTPDQVAKSD
jgi:hypothetical protein